MTLARVLLACRGARPTVTVAVPAGYYKRQAELPLTCHPRACSALADSEAANRDLLRAIRRRCNEHIMARAPIGAAAIVALRVDADALDGKPSRRRAVTWRWAGFAGHRGPFHAWALASALALPVQGRAGLPLASGTSGCGSAARR